MSSFSPDKRQRSPRLQFSPFAQTEPRLSPPFPRSSSLFEPHDILLLSPPLPCGEPLEHFPSLSISSSAQDETGPTRSTPGTEVTELVPESPEQVLKSKWCHVCASHCAHIAEYVACCESDCSIIVCKACFLRFSWEWGNLKTLTWKCVHCRHVCPKVAHCRISGKPAVRKRRRLR